MLENTEGNIISQIYPLGENVILSEQRAQELIPLLRALTNKVRQKITMLNSQKQHYSKMSSEYQNLEEMINKEFDLWCDHVQRLGAFPLSFGKCKIQLPRKSFLWEYQEVK